MHCRKFNRIGPWFFALPSKYFLCDLSYPYQVLSQCDECMWAKFPDSIFSSDFYLNTCFCWLLGYRDVSRLQIKSQVFCKDSCSDSLKLLPKCSIACKIETHLFIVIRYSWKEVYTQCALLQTYANRLLYSRMILFTILSNIPITRECTNRPLYEIREGR